MGLLQITPTLTISEDELDERFFRAGGPGGQNVNKVETAVQLRFDARRSPSLPNEVSIRLQALAGARLTTEGVIVITAQRHRTQERNRADALARLVELIARAADPPARRRATRPTKASKERRLTGKSTRGAVKRLRGKPENEG